jgi:hypothetical protein
VVIAARLVPQGISLQNEATSERITLRLPKFSCHQMVELSFA